MKVSISNIIGNFNIFTSKKNIFISLIIASITAATGLLDNSAIPIMGSMLISPLLTPLYLYLINHLSKQKLSTLLSNIFLLIILMIIAVIVGMISMYIYVKMSDNMVETTEMYSRTTYKHLYSNMILAFICGGLNIIAILNNSIVTKVGIGLSLTLLPPLVNAGMYIVNILLLKYSKKKYNLLINKTDLEEININNNSNNNILNNKSNNNNLNNKLNIEKFKIKNIETNINNVNDKDNNIKSFLISQFTERVYKSLILTFINVLFIGISSFLVLNILKKLNYVNFN